MESDFYIVRMLITASEMNCHFETTHFVFVNLFKGGTHPIHPWLTEIPASDGGPGSDIIN